MSVSKLIKAFEAAKQDNPYMYLEIAYTRQTDYMVWIADHPDQSRRTFMVSGQGATASKACKQALHEWRKTQFEADEKGFHLFTNDGPGKDLYIFEKRSDGKFYDSVSNELISSQVIRNLRYIKFIGTKPI